MAKKNLRNHKEEITKQKITNVNKNIAVIDIESNWARKIFSVGVVIADSTNFKLIDKKYWIIEKSWNVGGKYVDKTFTPLPLEFIEESIILQTRKEMIVRLINFLKSYKVKNWFSYTNYDFKHLPELHKSFEYTDISIFAKNKQFNKHIPLNAETTKNGDLKKGWGVEKIYRMVTKNENYLETHNALLDAMDELRIMELLGLDIETFLNPNNNKEKTTTPKKTNLTKASLNKKSALKSEKGEKSAESTKTTKTTKSTKSGTTVKSAKSTKSKNLTLN
ncbi:hypothetical protein [Mesomycoplasma ovipneumoniae]|uniref:hypothetical protein n=1 Tax=Mesomycoplasma ovipneumoniae TaxID=29562 RepID=UPI0039F5F017